MRADHSLTQLANEELFDSGCTIVTINFVLAETIPLRHFLNLHATVRFQQTLPHLIHGGPVQLVQASLAH